VLLNNAGLAIKLFVGMGNLCLQLEEVGCEPSIYNFTIMAIT
jgi:hypothetical protein